MIFDLDGTLVDSPALIIEVISLVVADLGGTPDAAAIRRTIGTPLEASFATLLGLAQTDEAVSVAAGRYRELFRPRILDRGVDLVFPGAATVLTGLREFARLGIATSKDRPGAEHTLAASGLRDYFDVVATTDCVPRPKPDPAMALFAAERLSVPPDEAVLVGDTSTDIAMGRAAGMRTVGVTYGVGTESELRAAGADEIAHDLPAVLAAVR